MKILPVFFATLLAGCANSSYPPLASTHPASPEAREGARIASGSSLRPDELTRKSHALLSAAQREQEQWDKFGPVSGTPAETPKTAPEAKP